MTLCAFLGGLATTAVILILCRLRSASPSSMILAGVALSSLFSGATTLLQYFADDVQLSTVVYWTFGDLGRPGWSEIRLMYAVTLAALVYFLWNRWNYNALSSGVQTAKSLGVSVDLLSYISMGLCTLIASVAVAFVGIVSFVGLIAPHIVRRFVGSDYRFLLPCSALAGSTLLLLGDLAAKAHPAARHSAHRRHHVPPGGAAVPAADFQRGGATMIEVQNLSFAYGSRPILQNVSFSLEQGECVAVLGNNGAGKSTLISCISRLRRPSSGSVLIDGTPVTQMTRGQQAQQISYVAQKNELAHTTVFDAVLLGRKPHMKWGPSDIDYDVAEHALRAVGMENCRLRYVNQLSGGEQQKVMLARAIAQEPKLMLLDEPTSSLDPRNQYESMELIRHCAHGHHIAVLVVIHDLNLALRFCDRFLFLKDGTVYASGGREAVTSENIRAVYGMDAAVEQFDGIPMVIPHFHAHSSPY